MHDAHSQMNERGEKGMGFSQSATTHHLFLKADGGVIQMEANDSTNTASRDEIRLHLGHIARAFQSGDFNIPMFVHDTVPPGVPEMKRLQKDIRYTFEESANGGHVIISSTNKDAVPQSKTFCVSKSKSTKPATQRKFVRASKDILVLGPPLPVRVQPSMSGSRDPWQILR
jgi:hypothetical protein